MRLRESSKPFKPDSIDVQIKKNKYGRWNACLETAHGDEEIFSTDYATKEQAEHAAMMHGYNFTGNPYTVRENRYLKNMVRRIIKEEQRRLNEIEVQDPETEALVEELANLSAINDKIEEEIAAIKAKYNAKKVNARIDEILKISLSDILYSCKKTDDRIVRTKKFIMKISRFPAEKFTYKYEEFFHYIMEKLNQQTKNAALVKLRDLETITQQKAAVSFTKADESVLREGIFDTIKQFATSVKARIAKMDIINRTWDALLDKAEAFLDKISKQK